MSKKEYTNYFPHDSNARNSDRLIRLRMQHGSAGYGVYFMILERLREESDYTSAKDYKMIAFDLREDEALVKSVIEDFELFVTKGKRFYSESFLRRMEIKDEKRKRSTLKAEAAAKARWGTKKTRQEPQAQQKTPRIKKPKPTQPELSTDPPDPSLEQITEGYLARFFDESKRKTLEAACMRMHISMETLKEAGDRCLESILQWEKKFHDYEDFAKYLSINLLPKKVEEILKETNKSETNTNGKATAISNAGDAKAARRRELAGLVGDLLAADSNTS